MKISLYLNEITKGPCVIGWCFSSVGIWRQASRIHGVSVVCDEQLSCWPAHEGKGCLTSLVLPQQPSEEHCWFELQTWRGRSCGWKSSGWAAHLQAKAMFSLHMQRASGWSSCTFLVRKRGGRQTDVFYSRYSPTFMGQAGSLNLHVLGTLKGVCCALCNLGRVIWQVNSWAEHSGLLQLSCAVIAVHHHAFHYWPNL